MSEQPIKFRYQAGVVTGGYSFSANNNTITLSGYIEKLENTKIREAVQYEAQKARAYYVEEIDKQKANGEILSTFNAKRDAVKKAKADAQAMFADIWDEVENAYKPPTQPAIVNDSESRNNLSCTDKEIKLLIALIDPNGLTLWKSYDGAELLADIKQMFETSKGCYLWHEKR